MADGKRRPDRACLPVRGIHSSMRVRANCPTLAAELPLRDQSFQLLLALLEHPGELLTREELTRPAVGGRHLRRLRSRPEQGRSTISGRRWRFGGTAALHRDAAAQGLPIYRAGHPRRRVTSKRRHGGHGALVEPSSLASLAVMLAAGIGHRGRRRHRRGPKSMASRSAAAPRIAALAVIPLENLSRRPRTTVLCRRADRRADHRSGEDGHAAGHVAHVGDAVPRDEEERSAEIGRELNVDAVVEGTVTYAGSRVRVTAQLIQVSTDMHLWADAYERDVS